MNDENTKAVVDETLERVACWLEAGAPHVATQGGKLVGFDMNLVEQQVGCGTVCCIYGAMCQFNKEGAVQFGHVYGERVERQLCFPDGYSNPDRFDKYNTRTAAKAIRGLLATGEVVWEQEHV